MPTSKSTTKSASSSSSESKAKKMGATASRSRSKGDETPDAIQLLTEDHREVKKLFKDFEKLVKDEAEGSEKQALAGQICEMLTIHTTIEEDIFYPAARGALEEQDLLDEAEVEHASAKELIAQIQSMEPEDDLYDAKVTVLGEYIEHHVQEEEKELFPKLKKAKLDLDQIGDELASRKEELQASQQDKAVH